jgi:origin recognition complex subunit 4
MLPALSDLSLALLIAAARLDLILETSCNFNMSYAEYSELASKMKAQSSASGALAIGHGAKVWGKEAAAKAWESLAELELILPAASAGGGGGVTAKARMYRVDVALEEIEGSVGINGLGGGMAKWCREI